jgi:hypothetical protein
MTLGETQALFHAAVTRQEGDGALDIDRCFTRSPALTAGECVEIYADMYLWRLADALREDYPKIARLLGDERFYALAAAYVHEYPSRHHDLGRLGLHLAAFLRAHPAPDRPDLADLATLEWARSEVFLEPDMEPASQDALAALPTQEFLRANPRLVPALRVVTTKHDVVGVWRALEHDQPAPPPAPGIRAIAVWRSWFQVFHTTLDLNEALALESAGAGQPLSQVCAVFGDGEGAAQAAFSAITSWFDEGWISSVEVAGQSSS